MSFLPRLISFHLRAVAVELNRAFDHTFANTALAGGTGKITTLFLVAANPGISQSAVGRALGKDRPAMVRIIDHLEHAGLLKRNPSPRERRSYALEVTAAGQAKLAEFERLAKDYDRDFFAVLTDDERDQLRHILAKLRRLRHFGTIGLDQD